MLAAANWHVQLLDVILVDAAVVVACSSLMLSLMPLLLLLLVLSLLLVVSVVKITSAMRCRLLMEKLSMRVHVTSNAALPAHQALMFTLARRSCHCRPSAPCLVCYGNLNVDEVATHIDKYLDSSVNFFTMMICHNGFPLLV